MFTHYQYIALLASFPLIDALHASVQTRDTTPNSPAWKWANDPTNCKTDTCLSDCQSATSQICSVPNLKTSNTVTVGDCTAYYYYANGNTVPTAAQCNTAFGQITGPPSKAGDPQDCPGYVGGALGFDSNNKRTNDPVYMVYPKAGNGNCMKAPGDTSPVLPLDEIPDSGGKKLPPTCPTSQSRRKRDELSTDLVSRDAKCTLEEFGTGFGCSATCVMTVTGTAIELGPLVAIGWLGCTGICFATALKIHDRCYEQQQGYAHPPPSLLKRGNNPCLNVPLWDWQCPALEQEVLRVLRCDNAGAVGVSQEGSEQEGQGGGVGGDGVAGVSAKGGGSGVVHF
ncbi:hypothetical protein ACLMJK_005494 [Lecanora helva]